MRGMEIPAKLEKLLQRAADHFAAALRTEGADAETIPDWLSAKAQSWIRQHRDTFTDMVLSAYRRLPDRQKSTRLALVDPIGNGAEGDAQCSR
jgi:hypothetical protein